ncbi:MAG: carbon storage regulator CsrA [Dehalococcoidia bacterium]
MLILTRKTDQGIVINHNIVVRVLAVDGERVKLGISAPRSVLVLREELCEEVRQENEGAAGASAADLAPLRDRLRVLRQTGSD